jgi:hypothetical protein
MDVFWERGGNPGISPLQILGGGEIKIGAEGQISNINTEN